MCFEVRIGNSFLNLPQAGSYLNYFSVSTLDVNIVCMYTVYDMHIVSTVVYFCFGVVFYLLTSVCTSHRALTLVYVVCSGDMMAEVVVWSYSINYTPLNAVYCSAESLCRNCMLQAT